MTQKEKATAYDEAVKRAKKEKEKSRNLGLLEFIEDTFPELRDSEDEKARKELISFLQLPHPQFVGERKQEKWIDWLEKQGTPKQVSIWKHWKDGIAGNGEGKPIYLVKIGNTYSLNSCLGFECDYIELSELDKLMLEKQNDTPMDVMDIEKQYDIDVLEKHITKDSISELAHTVIVRNGWEIVDAKEQKLVEKKELKKIVVPIFNIGDTIRDKDFYECGTETIKDIKDGQYIFTDGYGINIDEQEGWQLVKASANIEKKPMLSDFFNAEYERGKADALKSVEWSEEDEKMLNDIDITLFEENSIPNAKYWKFMNWLKSLKDRVRPQKQWKPSKEQMEALKEVCDKRWELDGLDPLYTLYEYLKKLTE